MAAVTHRHGHPARFENLRLPKGYCASGASRPWACRMGSVLERRSTLRLEHLPAMRRTLTAPLVQGGEDSERDAAEGIAEVPSPCAQPPSHHLQASVAPDVASRAVWLGPQLCTHGQCS